MRIATVKLRSAKNSPYSQSKYIEEPRSDKETAKDFEERTWRHRLHVGDNGEVFIQPQAFTNGLRDAAQRSGKQIPGKGKATYTKHFTSGVLVTEPVELGVKADAVDGEWLFVPSDGKRGGGKRVMKCFPKITSWNGEVKFIIMDDMITKDVFAEMMNIFGTYVGIGRFRPQNGGYYGRFIVESIVWEESDLSGFGSSEEDDLEASGSEELEDAEELEEALA